ACTGGAPRNPSEWSDATPRSISALAAATLFAASSIDGRSFSSVKGRVLGLLKYGEARVVEHRLSHAEPSKPSVIAAVIELHCTAYGKVQASASAWVSVPKCCSICF